MYEEMCTWLCSCCNLWLFGGSRSCKWKDMEMLIDIANNYIMKYHLYEI